MARDGEAGAGESYRALSRSLVVNPEDGSVYFTNADGGILRYDYARDAIERVAGEDLHLVTYDIPTGAYRDHGAIYYGDGQRPGWVNSIAIGADGTVYFIGRITRRGRAYMELLSVKPPPCPT